MFCDNFCLKYKTRKLLKTVERLHKREFHIVSQTINQQILQNKKGQKICWSTKDAQRKRKIDFVFISWGLDLHAGGTDHTRRSVCVVNDTGPSIFIVQHAGTWFHKGNCTGRRATQPAFIRCCCCCCCRTPVQYIRRINPSLERTAAISRQELMRLFRRARCILRLSFSLSVWAVDGSPAAPRRL